jgi:hypothetical protein
MEVRGQINTYVLSVGWAAEDNEVAGNNASVLNPNEIKPYQGHSARYSCRPAWGPYTNESASIVPVELSTRSMLCDLSEFEIAA